MKEVFENMPLLWTRPVCLRSSLECHTSRHNTETALDKKPRTMGMGDGREGMGMWEWEFMASSRIIEHNGTSLLHLR